MSELINLNNKEDQLSSDDFIKALKGKDLLIYEQIEGSKIFVNYDTKNETFLIRPKSIKNDPIGLIDLAEQKYWGRAYAFFSTTPRYVTNIINPKWTFVFTYLPNELSTNIHYDKVPLNNLILTGIMKGGKYTFNYEEILEYSKLFDCSAVPVVFTGQLSDKQLEVINLYLKTSEEDLKFVFGEESFAKFFYSILNPYIGNSFLMKDGEYNDNLERIIIRVDGDDKFTFAILNPLYERNVEENETEHAHVFSLILMSFLEFLQLKDINKIKVTGLTKDEIYINLISLLFNEYISNMKEDIASWEFFVPNFIKDDKFKINTDLIRNKDTQQLIKSSEKIEYIYKVILGSFKKYKKKPIGIMKESTIEFFNKKVDDISQYIEKLLNINRSYRYQKIDLLNFAEYFNMKFDRDGADEIYPDVSPNIKKAGDEPGIKKK